MFYVRLGRHTPAMRFDENNDESPSVRNEYRQWSGPGALLAV